MEATARVQVTTRSEQVRAGSGTVPARIRRLPVDPALAGLFPDQALQGGSVVGLAGSGGSVAVLSALLAPVMAQGAWVAGVGLPDLGLEAAAAMGVCLDRLVLVPDPGPRRTEVVGALLDAVDIVVVSPAPRWRGSDARLLAARVRQRHGLLVVVEPFSPDHPRSRQLWPESVDLSLETISSTWHGLDGGDGALCRREVTIRSFGRRGGPRERMARVWLPDVDGSIAPAQDRTGSTTGSTTGSSTGAEPAHGARVG